jgi:hypothetical protein
MVDPLTISLITLGVLTFNTGITICTFGLWYKIKRNVKKTKNNSIIVAKINNIELFNGIESKIKATCRDLSHSSIDTLRYTKNGKNYISYVYSPQPDEYVETNGLTILALSSDKIAVDGFELFYDNRKCVDVFLSDILKNIGVPDEELNNLFITRNK